MTYMYVKRINVTNDWLISDVYDHDDGNSMILIELSSCLKKIFVVFICYISPQYYI